MVEICGLKKMYDDKTVLDNINLNIPEGETAVIVGRSGCGKTVLLRLIIGLVKPEEGEIWIDGEEICRMNRDDLFRIRKKYGMLFQSAALFDSMTVEENIGLALKEHTDFSSKEIQDRVRQKLDLVGLPGIEDKKPAELSGGMKKRVGLARALVMDPQFVLFDEPTTGLDPVMADSINDLILETNRKLNITSVVVTHDMVSAFKIANRIAMISEGTIVFDGTPGEFKRCKNPAVRQFVEGRAN